MTSEMNSSSNAQVKKKRSPLFVIFLTVFLDLVGFGIILPVSPYLAKKFAATPTQIALLMAVYSIAQFLFSPFWGALSDRIGRRPVILISVLGGCLSYVLFAFAQSLPLLFVARALAGAFGGNISTAHAYIADVTKPEERSKGMGLIGAAFGLGFVFGPALGGIFGHVGEMLGSEPPFSMSFPALVAAALCLLNFAWAYFSLEESLPKLTGKSETQAHATPRGGRIKNLLHHLQRPKVNRLIIVFFLSGLAMAQMESMLFLFMSDRFGWGLTKASYGFAYVGVLMVITQGYLIRKWMPKYGEPKLLLWGLAAFSVSLFGIAFSFDVYLLAGMMTILALGNGLMRPPNVGMISLLTPADEQGAVLGVTNSVASLGRIIGPIFAGPLYENLGNGSPFWVAGVFSILAFFIIAASYSQLPQTGRIKV